MKFQSVLITGVSSGIGKSLSKHFLQNGASVFGLSRRKPDFEHDKLHHQSVDLTDYQAAEKAIDALVSGVEALDLVILNAGVLGPIADMASQDVQQMKSIMDVNVWANKAVLDTLLSKTNVSQVVTISSGAAVNGNRGWGGYSISKAALNMFTQLYAAENPEVHFTALAPGLVDTAMQEYLCALPEDDRFGSVASIASKRGTQWMPTPENVASRLVGVMEKLPSLTTSGGFVDVRSTEGWMEE